MHVCVNACGFVNACMYVCVGVYVCVHVCVYVCVCMCACVLLLYFSNSDIIKFYIHVMNIH